MKRRVTTEWRTKQRVMTITSQYGEALDVRQIGWAQEQALYSLLLPAYQVSSETGVAVLTYNITGLTSLKDYVRAYQVSTHNIVTWMCDLAHTYGRCTAGGEGRYWQRSLLFESDCVFVDAEGRMRFVFVPLHGVPFSAGNIPLTMLGFLADAQQVTYDGEQTRVFAAQLGSYVLEQQSTFSFNSYRALVQQMCGIAVSPSGEMGTRDAAPQTHVESPAPTGDPTVYDPIKGIPVYDPHTQYLAQGMTGVVTKTEVLGGSAGAAPAAHVLTRVGSGETFGLQEGVEAVVGRGSSCAVRLLGNSSISRQHVSLTVQGGEVVVRDLGSANGTVVGGARLGKLQAVTVALPCRITIGGEDLDIS